MALSFLFGAGTGETPDSIKRKRAIVQALIASQNAPRNVGEGLNALGDGIVANVLERRADKADAAGQSAANADFSPLISGFGGSPSTPGATGGAMPTAKADGSIAPTKLNENDTYNGFIDTVKSGITNPYGLAAVAATGNAESSFDPRKANAAWADPSQSGQAGTAGGIMSWRNERLNALKQFAQANGEQPGSISPQTQAKFFLQEDPSLVAKLNGAKSVEEAQAAMNNAWKFAGYDRPGGETARRMASAASLLPRFQGTNGGQQVASLDPSAGMGAPQPQVNAPAAPFPPAPVNPAANQPIDPASASPQQLLAALGSGPAPDAAPYSDPMVTTAARPPVTMASQNVPGLVSPGNIDLSKRPVVKNPDGSVSTVRSVSFNQDGKEILVPTVSDDGRIMSNDEALAQYRKTGQNLGVFDSPASADAYAQSLHNQQADMYAPQQGQPSSAPPLSAPVDVASIPNTPGSQPAPANPAQIPPEFQNSPQLMNADPSKGIMPVLLGGQPVPSSVANALAGSPQAASAPQAPSPVAQALAAPQAGPSGAFPAAPGASAASGQASAPSTAVAQALTGQQNGPSQQQILKVLTNPFATPEQRSVAQFMLEKQQQQNDPLRQLQVQELQTKIDQQKNPLPDYGFETLPDGTVIRTEKRTGEAKPIYQSGAKPVVVNNRLVDPQSGKVLADFSDPKTAVVEGKVIDTTSGKVLYDGGDAGKWTKLDNGALFNEKTGEVRSAVQAGGKPGFRFNGDSIEGQALNGQMDSGRLTADQAQQIAAGKQITGPNGEILFMSPQGLVSQPANGGPPQLVSPPAAPAPQPTNQGIDIFAHDPAAPAQPTASSASPAPIPPANAPQPAPTVVPRAANVPNGAIQLTGPKAANGDEKKAMTFADRMTASGNILDDIGNVGTDTKESFLDKIPLVGNMLVNDKYQQYDQARRDFINAQLRRESGAAIAPSEFDNANKQYFPQPGDSEDTIKQKAANRRLAINGMIRDGGPTYVPQQAPAPAASRPRATNPKTGQTVEYDGTQWVPVQ